MKFSHFTTPDKAIYLSEEEFFHKLALEAYFGENVVEFFKDSANTLIQKFRSLLPTFDKIKENPDVSSIEKHLFAILGSDMQSKFLSYRETLVQVPEGFKGQFLPCVIELNSIGARLFEDAHKLFSEYRLVISTVVSNKDGVVSNQDLSSSYEKFTTARTGLARDIGKYFTEHDTSRARLGDVVHRYTDLKVLAQEVKQLAKRVELSEVKKLEKLVKETAELLTVIENRVLDANSQGHIVDKTTVKNIASGAFELAKYIDQCVVYYYTSMSMIGSSRNLFEQLEQMKTAK